MTDKQPSTLLIGWRTLCPRCQKDTIYPSIWSLNLKEKCTHCHLNLKKNDSADGPAVFMIFALGTLIVPLALLADAWFTIPLWLHGVIWTALTLFLTLGAMRQVKAFIIALQYKHLPWDTQTSNEDPP